MQLPTEGRGQAPEAVADVIDQMVDVSAGLPPGDGVRAFNEMYLTTTRNVDEAITGMRFADAEFMTRLDVVFAQLYLGALRRSAAGQRPVPRCWGVLFDARARTDVIQLQFAVAGMNAHINFDLAHALVLTARELGGGLNRARRDDFVTINAVLGSTQPAVRQQLLTGPLAGLDRALGTRDDRLALWGIERAREFAWRGALALRGLHGTAAEDDYLDGIDRLVAMSSRLLLMP